MKQTVLRCHRQEGKPHGILFLLKDIDDALTFYIAYFISC